LTLSWLGGRVAGEKVRWGMSGGEGKISVGKCPEDKLSVGRLWQIVREISWGRDRGKMFRRGN